jgi:hypothetical protein
VVKIFSYLKRPDRLCDPPSPIFNDTGVIFQGIKGGDLNLTTDLNLILRIRMSGAVPLLSLFACMDFTGTTVPIVVIIITIVANCTAQEDCILTELHYLWSNYEKVH